MVKMVCGAETRCIASLRNSFPGKECFDCPAQIKRKKPLIAQRFLKNIDTVKVCFFSSTELCFLHVNGLQSLSAFLHIIRNVVIIFNSIYATLNILKMHKKILAFFGNDESISFLRVKPFYFSSFHNIINCGYKKLLY